MESLAKGMENFTNATFFLTIILQVLLNQVLKRIWPLFNATQLLITYYAFKCTQPVNVEFFLLAIKDILELKAIPKDKIKASILDMPPVKYLMENINVLLIIGIPLTIFLVLQLFCIFKCMRNSECGKKIIKKISETVFWSLIIRVVLTSFISVC